MDPVTGVPLPPGGPIEIAFSFDTTGSMSECLDRVRAQLAEVIQRLTADIPGLRIAVIAHGDYCDEEIYGYVTKHVDFTNDVAELCRFVGEVGATGGGDFEECYELVLRQSREQLSWQPATQRALVVIGDATPHEADYKLNTQRIDWRKETQLLVNHGVHIYAVQCLNNSEADDFYQHLADTTGGKHLKLDELSSIVDTMMAICYREKGVEFFDGYEQEVRQRDGSAIRADLDRMFASLRDRDEAGPSTSSMDSDDVVHDDDEHDDDDVPSTSGYTFNGIPAATPGPSWATPVAPAPRARSGSVGSSSEGSVTSSRTSGSSRSRRSTGTFTRSHAHPMARRRRTTTNIVKRSRRRSRHGKAKQTPSQRSFEKALRERLHGEDFPLADLPWSRWQQAVSPTSPAKGQWQQRPGGRIGERRRQLFDGDVSVPAVYEVAVQVPNSQTKTPVFAKVTSGIRGRHWERALFSRPHVNASVNDVLTKGCKLYIRRAPIENEDDSTGADKTVADLVGDVRKLMTSCDYAWGRHMSAQDKSMRCAHRELVRKGVHISESN